MTLPTLLPALFAAAMLAASPASAADDLKVWFIDVEGGQATLFLTPAGESVLVDAGWPGFGDRDAQRIASAAKEAGITSIDYLLVTHFHMDHVGGVPGLVSKIPVKTFVDHGESIETDLDGKKLFDAYLAVRDKGKHLVVKPGDKLPLKGVEWTIVSAGGKSIQKPLKGAGKPNTACAGFQKREVKDDENGQSTGSFIRFGKFTTIDLGDLLWNKEEPLVCPSTKIPPVDLYITSHHGMNMSGSPAFVGALHPKVAVMDSGARKGGTAEAWDTMHAVPGIRDIWQSHFAVAGGKEHNSPEDVIANVAETPDSGFSLKLVAHKDGHFEITNARNGYSKQY